MKLLISFTLVNKEQVLPLAPLFKATHRWTSQPCSLPEQQSLPTTVRVDRCPVGYLFTVPSLDQRGGLFREKKPKQKKNKNGQKKFISSS